MPIGQVSIFAMPINQEFIDPKGSPTDDDNYLGGNDIGNRARITKTIVQNGYQVVNGYADLADLFGQIRALLKATHWKVGGMDVHGACLQLLEVDAHGAPSICDALSRGHVAQFVTELKKTNLCDKLDIYLSGCNTAVNNANGPSIAQTLSAAGPTRATDNVDLTVWGTVGYFSGTNAEGNGKCSKECATGTGKKNHYHSPYPASADGRFPGSRSENDAKKCFAGFREGQPI
jgi:hypothetical protein